MAYQTKRRFFICLILLLCAAIFVVQWCVEVQPSTEIRTVFAQAEQTQGGLPVQEQPPQQDGWTIYWQSRVFPEWWITLLMCVIAAVLLFALTLILSAEGCDRGAELMWHLSGLSLIGMIVFAPLSWWVISLIEVGVIALTFGLGFLLKD